VIVTATVLAGAWFAYQRLVAAQVRVLAVMPLRNTSRDTVETAFVGEGLGQELVRRLGAAGGFRILPWTTTAALPSRGRKPEALAHELGADVLLFGSYSDDGDQLQALVELVDGHSGLQLWSERYTRASADLIGLQTDLATAVAARVGHSSRSDLAQRIALTTPGNAEAYDLYIRAASYWHSPDAATRDLAEPLFMRAVALDPTLAVAWVGLGALRVDNYMAGESSQNLVQADSCFQRALVLDPQLPEAIRGRISLASEIGETDECLKLAGDVLRQHPGDPNALITAGWGFHLGGLSELAVPALDKALALNPNDPAANFYRVFALCWSGQDRRCLEEGKAYIRRFGEEPVVYGEMGWSAAAVGDRPTGIVFHQRAFELGMPVRVFAAALGAAGQHAQERALLDSTIATTRILVGAHPDNLRLRADLATQLALRGLGPERDAEIAAITSAVRQGASITGSAISDIPFCASAAGDLDAAIWAARQLSVNDRTWAGFWVMALLVERGAYLSGGRTPEFLRSAEFSAIRRELDAYHSQRMAIYQPILERALRR
jgi:TolB-like protein